MSCNLPFFVKNYFEFMDKHKNKFCKWQWKLREQVINAFENEDLYADTQLAIKYFGLSKYLGIKTFEWQEFLLGLHLCVFKKIDNYPRWHEAIVLMGRGNGKDGTISLQALALASPYNTIKEYDIDICAYNEDQAKRPVNDIITAFEQNPNKFKKFFYWTKESVRGLKRNTYIKGHTNNAKGKDGLRSGCVIFNEYHTYENYANVDVFTTGLGKKQHPRMTIYTTNGNVVDGPLDELIEEGKRVLNGEQADNGTLYFFCMLNEKEDVHNEDNWYMANPSLFYLPNLLTEIRKEYKIWSANPARLPGFMTKRMGIRESNNELPVTAWENIEATKKEYDEKLSGCECIAGIDFTKTTDWASVNLHFKNDVKRIDINKAWICMNNPEINRLRCPYQDWAEKGYIDLVYDVEIDPLLISNYIYEMSKIYRIKAIYMDSYRYALLRDYLEKIGFSVENKNIFLVRPSDIMKVYPVIDRCFSNQYFYWGNQPHLRWSTNNTKLVKAKKSSLAKDGELDIGNYLFGKIEPKTRKTDPFMALVHSMCGESKLTNVVRRKPGTKRVRVKIY